jgi:hypothetical protein
MYWNLLEIKKEAMFLSGIEYKGLVHAKFTREAESPHSL